jgi:putative RNA methyltransferase MTH_724
MKYVAIAGRQPLISLAEIQALYDKAARLVGKKLVFFEINEDGEENISPDINRLGGSLKLGRFFDTDFSKLAKFLATAHPEGKITLGISDFSKQKKSGLAKQKSMELKRNLARVGRSVRVITSNEPEISSATAHHNQLGEKAGCFEIFLIDHEIYLSLGTQNITAYTERDQARPARDAKVGMLPPKLAQILINLCGKLPEGARVLDPFCGTGVVLQEAAIMGYVPYGTDLNERMVEYSKKNLSWLFNERNQKRFKILPDLILKKDQILEAISVGDATNFTWEGEIDAVAFEGYLGAPMSKPPVDIKFKTEKAKCREIAIGFLKNITPQIKSGTPVVMALPAWLRENGKYAGLNILDEIQEMGYNFEKFQDLSQSDLLYYREGQIVAREIIVIRKR